MFSTADTEDIPLVTSFETNSSAASDAQDSTENTQVATQQSSRELTLNMLIKELVFCVALALTTYGALHNTPTKVSKHPTAIRFFSPDSVVKDWYRGQLSHALATINKVDISFVMYYAPWDAESQYVRNEFEKAANVLHDRVLFSAINCWNPGSECRLQNSKIPSWPILMVYTVLSRGIIYKGPRDAHSMVNFLELMMKPLKRVTSADDLVNLLSKCDAVAIGYTPLTETSKYYNIWYTTALRVKEADTMGEVCFGAVTSEEVAIELGMETIPSARLMLWNDTKEYVSNKGDMKAWNDSALVSWILHNFAQPVARIVPLWRKDFNFENYVDGNPILMLFTPLNPLYEQLPAYSLMREVAMEYYGCKTNFSSQWTSELVKLQQVQRLLYQQKNYTQFCQEYKYKQPIKKPSRWVKKGIESHNNKYPWSNATYNSEKSRDINLILKKGFQLNNIASVDKFIPSLDWLQECSLKDLAEDQCKSMQDNYNFEQEIFGPDETETTMLPNEDDPLSPKNLLQENIKHFCNILKFANEWGPSGVPIASHVDDVKNFTRLDNTACSNNYTMHILAVDSVRNHHFAEALGIDISNKKDLTAVIILDSKHESQYVLSEDFNAKSIREFIYNFTKKNLKRSLRTHVNDAAHTHYFGSNGVTEQMGINKQTEHIVELTSRSFRRMVKTPGNLTIVAVCGGSCSAATSRAIISAQKLLQTCALQVLVARLDALRHDLPWHYTVHHYPTLLVFPPHRRGEADSESYPGEERVTSAGVVALALRSLSAPEHLRVRLALCVAVQGLKARRTCLKDIKEHVTSLIGRNLKYWRRTEDQNLRNALFTRLRHLHELSLHLSLYHVSELNAQSAKNITISNILSVLSRHWDIDISSLTHTSQTTAS